MQRLPMSRHAIALSMALALAACGPTSQSPSPSPSAESFGLHVVNVDGPGVIVLVAGEVEATVPCGGSATLAPDGSIPELPWAVEVRADDGQVLRAFDISGPAPQGVLVRGREVLIGSWPMSYGPAPTDACASMSP